MYTQIHTEIHVDKHTQIHTLRYTHPSPPSLTARGSRSSPALFSSDFKLVYSTLHKGQVPTLEWSQSHMLGSDRDYQDEGEELLTEGCL